MAKKEVSIRNGVKFSSFSFKTKVRLLLQCGLFILAAGYCLYNLHFLASALILSFNWSHFVLSVILLIFVAYFLISVFLAFFLRKWKSLCLEAVYSM